MNPTITTIAATDTAGSNGSDSTATPTPADRPDTVADLLAALDALHPSLIANHPDIARALNALAAEAVEVRRLLTDFGLFA